MQRTILVLAAAILFCAGFAVAASASGPAASVNMASVEPGRAVPPVNGDTLPAYLDEDLASKYADFARFAKTWIRKSNLHHMLSKSRMQIKPQGDGTYSAVYQSSDENDVICTVKKSANGIYTAILRYKEIIYKTIATSPEACRTAEFIPSLINRRIRIFKLKGGTWE